VALSFPAGLLIASIVVAVVGHVEAGALEDNGWWGEHPSHVTMASWALCNRWVVEMLKTFEVKATFEAFVFIHGHGDISLNLAFEE
jgi:hypothetical protein